jgi:hypothetical protein
MRTRNTEKRDRKRSYDKRDNGWGRKTGNKAETGGTGQGAG